MWLDPLGKWTSLAKTNTAAAGLANGEFEDASALATPSLPERTLHRYQFEE